MRAFVDVRRIRRLDTPSFELRSRLGVSAAFLTDIHLSWMVPPAVLEAVARQIEEIAPEILFYGGDFGEDEAGAREALSILSGLRPKYGAYCVAGNNDAEAFPSMEAFREAAAKAGIRLLVNEEVRVAGLPLVLAGLDEPRHGRPDATGLFSGASAEERKVLLSHYPQCLKREIPKCAEKPDLALCGHTHGGQICLLGLSVYQFGYEREHGKPPVVRGIGEACGVPCVVSAGLGTSHVPFRLFAPPELWRIKL